jgi:carboxypeptidase Taq
MGAIGYFPTYCLGNLYAAQFAAAMRRDLPKMDEDIQKGRFESLLSWQREKIHRYGSVMPAEDLVKKVTGRELSSESFMQYLEAKCADIYGI